MNFNLSLDAHGQANEAAGLASAGSSKSGLPGQYVGIGHGSWINGTNYQCAGGGTGWLSEGAHSSHSGTFSTGKIGKQCGNASGHGRDVLAFQPLIGGYGTCSTGNENGNVGGFGGGGGGGCGGEGGGGGYTGGAGTYSDHKHGGGAGSFNGGTNQINQTGANQGHGSVTITLIK